MRGCRCVGGGLGRLGLQQFQPGGVVIENPGGFVLPHVSHHAEVHEKLGQFGILPHHLQRLDHGLLPFAADFLDLGVGLSQDCGGFAVGFSPLGDNG